MKIFIRSLFLSMLALFVVFQIAFAAEQTPAQTTVSVARLLSNVNQYPDDVTVQGYVSKVVAEDSRIELTDPHHMNMNGDARAHKACPDTSKASAEPVTGTDRKCTKNTAADAGTNGYSCPMAQKKTGEAPYEKTCTRDMTKTCGKTGLAQSLTVQWNGDMPEISVPVSVSGRLTQKDGHLVFVAKSLMVLNN